MATVNKRETSFEGLAASMENGENGIYGLVTQDRNIIFQPRITITKKDLEEIPALRQLRAAITSLEASLKRLEGRPAYIVKQTLIELRKDQYVIKMAYRKPVTPQKLTRSKAIIPLDEKITIDKDGVITPHGVSLLNPKVVSAILCNYSSLKEDVYDQLDNDLWYLMIDFDFLAERALAEYPLYERLVECKIDGLSNSEIQHTLQFEFGIKHSIEYISSLWRNKIPQIIATKAEEEWLSWHYLQEEKGQYKRCSRCGQIKLAHNKYFSKNNTSKDGFYSICKECRNRRKK